MPQTPKKKPKSDEGATDERGESLWSENQKNHEYYYDDAHGYEVYKPDEDEKEGAD